MTPAMSTPNDPATIVRSYLAAFESGDARAISNFVTEDFVNDHTAALGEGCEGRSVYRDRLGGFLGDMVGLRYEIENLVCDGNEVAVFYKMTASWQGTKPFEIRGAQRLVVRDGLIAHRTDYWDSASFLTQIE